MGIIRIGNVRLTEIAPSILSDDFGRLSEETEKIAEEVEKYFTLKKLDEAVSNRIHGLTGEDPVILYKMINK